MTDILCIPQKLTVDAHLKEQLAHAIELTSYQAASFFETELNRVANLRNSLLDPEPSQAKLRDLKQYWLYLHELQKKFPDDQIEFTWIQPLSPKSEEKSAYSFTFERFNILYNIGSLYSILALEANDGSSHSLKTMCLYFQYSAGCFQNIINHLNECNIPVIDLNGGNALVYIMLSQAQECFWFKAKQGSHKDSLVAKLAQQVVEYYGESLRFARGSKLIRSDWCLHLESKVNYFKAVTSYRNGLSLGEKKCFGAEIKSLEIALVHLKKSTFESTSDFISKIEDLLEEVQTDNDFIYLQAVPSKIEPVKPAPMVKALPLDAFIEDQISPIFRDLLPIRVMDACSAYNERQEEYVKQYVVEPLLSLSKLLNEGIPKSELPPDMENISKQEFESYASSLKDLSFNSKNIEAQLLEIEKILEEEFVSDTNLRTKYGTIHWLLSPSSNVTNVYYEKLKKSKDYLNIGRKVDEETFSLFDIIDEKLITSPLKLPESNSPLVRQVGNITKARKKYIRDVELKSAEHRVLSRVISEYKKTGEVEFEALFLEHLKYFDTDIKYVQSQKIENKTLLEQLQSQDENHTPKRLDATMLHVEDLRHSLKLLEDVKKNLEDGTKFYQSLRRTVCGLLCEVQTFERSRRAERELLESKLLSM